MAKWKKLRDFVNDNQKHFNEILRNYEIKDSSIESLYDQASNSFRNKIDHYPNSSEDKELLTIQWLVNEYRMEEIDFKINKHLFDSLKKLDKYFDSRENKHHHFEKSIDIKKLAKKSRNKNKFESKLKKFKM